MHFTLIVVTYTNSGVTLIFTYTDCGKWCSGKLAQLTQLPWKSWWTWKTSWLANPVTPWQTRRSGKPNGEPSQTPLVISGGGPGESNWQTRWAQVENPAKPAKPLWILANPHEPWQTWHQRGKVCPTWWTTFPTFWRIWHGSLRASLQIGGGQFPFSHTRMSAQKYPWTLASRTKRAHVYCRSNSRELAARGMEKTTSRGGLKILCFWPLEIMKKVGHLGPS